MKQFLNYVADYKSSKSLALKMRQKRFALFMHLLETLPKPKSILDVGGTQLFWEMMGFTELEGMKITLLNKQMPETRPPYFSGLEGDARDLSAIDDNAFDVVFSNSVIEHVGNFDQQRLMAKEIMRVGQRYFVQTPNLFFPIEPHYLFPGFQWLPLGMKVWLVSHFDLGHIKRITDPQKAREQIESIRLLKKDELSALFPKSIIYEEKFMGLTKSFIAYSAEWKNEFTVYR